MDSRRIAHYHLPGLFEFFEFYQVFLPLFYAHRETSLDKGTQRKTTENELPSLTQCTA